MFCEWSLVLYSMVTALEAFCYVELGLMFPEMGGAYIFIKRGFGDLASFLYLWVSWAFLTPASSAAVALTFSTYFCQVCLNI